MRVALILPHKWVAGGLVFCDRVSGASVEMFPWQKLCQKGHLASHVGAKGR